uniref:Nucleoporin Nup54 alpha-helical domain-containing protein n=1 Tax=Acrobeloides nanus TaxID=290746 RepID=A0A914C189_9BILA
MFGATPTATGSTFANPPASAGPSLFSTPNKPGSLFPNSSANAPAATTNPATSTAPMFSYKPGSLFSTTTTTTTTPALFTQTTTAPSFLQNKASAPPFFTTTPALFTQTTTAPSFLQNKASAPPFFSSLAGTTLGTSTTTNTEARTLQNLIHNSGALVHALSGPALYPDEERNAIVAKLNQLLAANGVGSGYFKEGQNPIAFDMNNPFYRLKAIGYNRLTDQVSTSQQKQKIIDALYVILGSKPNVQALIQNIRPLSDNLTEISIYVIDKNVGKVCAKDLYKYLVQPDKLRMVQQQLQCEKVVPRIELTDQELKNHLKRAPPGFDETYWAQAVRENPDSSRLVPHPVRGFQQLCERQKMQRNEIELEKTVLENFRRRLNVVEKDLANSQNKFVNCKQTQKLISYRMLRIVATQTLVQRYGLVIDEDEENLLSRLETCNALLNAPDQLKARISDLCRILRERGDEIKSKGNMEVKFSDMEINHLKRYLERSQQKLESLVEIVNSNLADVKIISENLNII